MLKENFVAKLAEDCECSKAKAKEILDRTFGIITECLKDGESVSINGFGTFKIAHRKKRIARNPQTGAKVEVKAKKAPLFKASTVLKEAVK